MRYPCAEILPNAFKAVGSSCQISGGHLLTAARFAFIEYENADDALKAVEEMNGKEYHGFPLQLEVAKGWPKRYPYPNLAMSSLPRIRR